MGNHVGKYCANVNNSFFCSCLKCSQGKDRRDYDSITNNCKRGYTLSLYSRRCTDSHTNKGTSLQILAHILIRLEPPRDLIREYEPKLLWLLSFPQTCHRDPGKLWGPGNCGFVARARKKKKLSSFVPLLSLHIIHKLTPTPFLHNVRQHDACVF